MMPLAGSDEPLADATGAVGGMQPEPLAPWVKSGKLLLFPSDK